jgi:hypothetical protein
MAKGSAVDAVVAVEIPKACAEGKKAFQRDVVVMWVAHLSA